MRTLDHHYIDGTWQPSAGRIALVQRITAVCERRIEEMALAITTEMGAPYAQLAKTLQTPIGGCRYSGLGREWGAAGIDAFTQIKAVMGGASAP